MTSVIDAWKAASALRRIYCVSFLVVAVLFLHSSWSKLHVDFRDAITWVAYSWFLIASSIFALLPARTARERFAQAPLAAHYALGGAVALGTLAGFLGFVCPHGC